MILQSIISQSNINSLVLDETPSTSWGAALDGNYTTLSGITKSTIFIPTTTDVDTYNHHIQSFYYYDAIHCIFSTHENAELGYGSRIRYSKSTDYGVTWSTPIELLEAQDDSTADYTTVSGRQSIACGFAIYNSELYAIISVDELGANASYRSGVGILAVKINSNATFGIPVWIDTPESDFVAPSAVPTYTSYSFDTSLRTNLRSYMILNQYKSDQISYFATSTSDPLYVREDYSGNELSEPSVAKLPNGQYIKLWKGVSNYKTAQTSTNQISWGNTFLTNIPDGTGTQRSRERIYKMNNGNVCVIGNNQGTSRDPLYFSMSSDGLNYASGNTYNIDVTTYGSQFSGQGKSRGAQHPTQPIELPNGKLCVCYNWNKEEVYSATFDIPSLV